MPLRVGLAGLVALIAALVLTVAGSLFLHASQAEMRAAIDNQLQNLALDLGRDLDDDTRITEVASSGYALMILSENMAPQWSSWLPGDACPAIDQIVADRHRPNRPIWTVCNRKGTAWRVLLAPATADPAGRSVMVATSLEPAEAARANVWRTTLMVATPLVVLSGLGAWILAGAALRPVERMRREAAAISGADVDARLAVPATRDEVAALAGTFNDLLGRIHQALTREREFVADAGHELRTPLTILRAELELAVRPGRSAEELREALVAAQGETERLIRLAEDLLLLARAQSGAAFLNLRECPLADAVVPSVRSATRVGAQSGITVSVTGDLSLHVVADADRMRQALDNILANAFRHTPAPGQITVAITELAGQGQVSICVQDSGEGFPEEFLPHAFSRFRRADSARSRDSGGTGLGLAIVRSIIEGHGGTVAAANRAGGGAEVTVILPLTSA